MCKEEKVAVIVGAVAAIAPLAVEFVSLDAAEITNRVVDSSEHAIGYCIKVFGLMFVGGFVVWINKEKLISKAFQLGVMAPAIILGMVTTSSLENAKEEIEVLSEQLANQPDVRANVIPNGVGYVLPPEQRDRTFFSLSFFSQAHAITELESEPVIGQHNTPSLIQRLWYGATGKINKGWFVIVGSHTNDASATAQANSLIDKGFNAKVYEPFGVSKYFGVMIASYVSLETAREIKEEAIVKGLPEDIYIWKWKS
ncbi:hypothetical protein GMES_4404 [Paraglaciecola mesophila KMM 241]|uniref:SPOR domain-containing protein n=1 Tax=Paraglaciecola mesophila KMM 241 TaxID=1128912 RepID=K6ZTM7_9ALTE|nr:SPOR domain-containing protein [Paraglaciecola mesophila]GAC26670.1 hypothetical protein GMES_4404 [Paraglaciecola mesophila KMM 241]